MLKKRILSIVLALTMLMVPGAYAAQPAKDDMRGVWVASVHNIDFPSDQGMTADQLKAEADTELDNIAAMGLNTVFLQVRPSADALYPSELFPWSRYVSGGFLRRLRSRCRGALWKFYALTVFQHTMKSLFCQRTCLPEFTLCT